MRVFRYVQRMIALWLLVATCHSGGWRALADGEDCGHWEPILQVGDGETRFVEVTQRNNDSVRIICPLHSQEAGLCVRAPQGDFNVMALVRCPEAESARDFDTAVAEVGYSTDLSLTQVCTVVRVGPGWALTARHCFEDDSADCDEHERENGDLTSPACALSPASEFAVALDFQANDKDGGGLARGLVRNDTLANGSARRVLSVGPVTAIHVTPEDADLALIEFDLTPNPYYRTFVLAPDGSGSDQRPAAPAEIFGQEALKQEFAGFAEECEPVQPDDYHGPCEIEIWGYGEREITAEDDGLRAYNASARFPVRQDELEAEARKTHLRFGHDIGAAAVGTAPVACGGDSGGPGLILGTVVYAITNSTTGNCTPGGKIRGGAILVEPFCGWIEKTTCENSTDGRAVCCLGPLGEEEVSDGVETENRRCACRGESG